MNHPGDDCQIRCPRLGHQISFPYCLSENDGLPCSRTIDCWDDYFEVEEFLRKRLSLDEWEKAFKTPPKPKMISLIELIERAKKAGRDKT